MPLLHALNSSTFTHGRSAFQATFGRVPRIPGGILTDDHALATSPDQAMIKAEVIRNEAIKALADLNVSSHLRRAMLRKTVKTRVPDLLPGQPCAFWRWNRRGPKKRGSWTMARFLSWDPSSPGKLAWLRCGSTTTLVSAEQLRSTLRLRELEPQ